MLLVSSISEVHICANLSQVHHKHQIVPFYLKILKLLIARPDISDPSGQIMQLLARLVHLLRERENNKYEIERERERKSYPAHINYSLYEERPTSV